MQFHVTVDFNDDVWFGKGIWDEQSLRKLIRTYAANGISAIHWIENGRIDDGMYDAPSWMEGKPSVRQAVENIGDPLAVVCDAAHRAGIKAYAVLKVNDLAFTMPWASRPPGSPSTPADIPHVGGMGMGLRWIAQHADLRAKLHPSLRERLPRRPIRTIRLWHENAGVAPCKFEILVSSDNRHYSLYQGPQRQVQEVRRRKPPLFAPAPEKRFADETDCMCIELTDLQIDSPFLLLRPVGPCSLANTMVALLEVFDSDGSEAACTPGLAAIQRFGTSQTWQENGVAFDAAFTTNVNGRGYCLTRSGGPVKIELSRYGFVALARGRNDYLAGVMEMVHPQVRHWYTGMCIDCIHRGVDGIDIRLNTHTESLDWENYGFSEPIIQEFRKRYGVDIATQPFDRSLWRKLRGEYFTAFMQQASAATHSLGREFLVHFYSEFNHPVQDAALLETYFDWQGWLDSKLIDRASIRDFAFRDPFYEVVMNACDNRGVGRIMTHSMHSANDEVWGSYGQELIDHALAEGFEAFNIYESSVVARLVGSDIVLKCPSLWRRIAKEVGA